MGSILLEQKQSKPSRFLPDVVAVLDEAQHVFRGLDDLLLEAAHLHLLFTVLQHPQLLLFVEQVEHLATVDLKEAGRHLEVQLLVARVQQPENIRCYSRSETFIAMGQAYWFRIFLLHFSPCINVDKVTLGHLVLPLACN